MNKKVDSEIYPPDLEDKMFKDLIKTVEDDNFHIGQCYDEIPCKTLFCIKCGSDKFIVGEGDYYTAIKCPICKYEICIHNG